MSERSALISVYDKTGVVEVARAVAAAGYRILSTGGTATALEEAGLDVEQVSAYTDFPEIMDGRVKTLHPKIHGGLLGRRDDGRHASSMRELGIAPIDVVVVNLYPFVETIRKPGVTEPEAIEQIDIGGPSMLRAAAKNHEYVTVVCDPGDYPALIAALGRDGVPADLRRELSRKVFARTAAYDAAIARWMAGDEPLREVYCAPGERVRSLRYGENPHQAAAFYALPTAGPGSVAGAEFLGSDKELSYNNILDVDAALALAREFPGSRPACVIVKHNNPCGAATGNTLADAYGSALECDPVSAFGSIVACNVGVDAAAAERIAQPGNFVEALIAPSCSAEAVEILRAAKFGKNLRILTTGTVEVAGAETAMRSVSGGFLVQHVDAPRREVTLEYVTKRRPTRQELSDLRFAWPVAKHVRSNAIVFAKDGGTVGVGAGQMSRVDAVEIALRKAGGRARGAVMASDAFFPFPDGLEKAADAGVTAVIQPGGSRRDAAVIAAADARDVAMVFTGTRHFKH